MTPILLKAVKNEENYKKRVSRTEIFLGKDELEWKQSQDIIASSTIGIAGCGGIGGAMALRLARFGVKKLKLADPDSFDWSNLNRQYGASIDTIGRNKAEVVGDLVFNLAKDVEIEIYPDGITTDNAESFVDGCDLVLDQLDFYVINEKFALHKAFRNCDKTKLILACSVVGWAAHLYKFEKNSMPIEKWYRIDGNETLPELTEKLATLWAPKLPHFPSYEKMLGWMLEKDTVPIFAGTPPLAEGILIQRVILALIDKEYPPYAKWLPPIPQMYVYDAATLTGEIVTADGNYKNREELKIMWQHYIDE
ncbi:ThiF family adenylyltransferase [Bisgaard Taxon 10/6]|uniref:ThiF family adenylyltransferase n=1 Tax=Exercitatus varius TaxID=67857 RepID=UPI00294B6012|nr:ThiF family adenylyltransferase [Exercitatus varius]MDG2916227.1 ThiF family adenylyltransferase [Exercitatus varius]MDG2952066.1 ThiF family adenylyltransferase [Exercitatus varius]MDG2957401.1 ThiF family adenylyltransferase [Exercitatus varius]